MSDATSWKAGEKKKIKSRKKKKAAGEGAECTILEELCVWDIPDPGSGQKNFAFVLNAGLHSPFRVKQHVIEQEKGSKQNQMKEKRKKRRKKRREKIKKIEDRSQFMILRVKDSQIRKEGEVVDLFWTACLETL